MCCDEAATTHPAWAVMDHHPDISKHTSLVFGERRERGVGGRAERHIVPSVMNTSASTQIGPEQTGLMLTILQQPVFLIAQSHNTNRPAQNEYSQHRMHPYSKHKTQHKTVHIYTVNTERTYSCFEFYPRILTERFAVVHDSYYVGWTSQAIINFCGKSTAKSAVKHKIIIIKPKEIPEIA